MNLADTTAHPITADEERRLVHAAQTLPLTDPGREHALDALTRAYMPAIRGAAFRITSANRIHPLEHDDAIAAAALAFIECVHTIDLDMPGRPRLAAYAPTLMTYAVLAEQRSLTALTVAPRTGAKFFAHLRAHNSNVAAAMNDADGLAALEMRRETFMAVYEAFKPAESIQAQDGFTGPAGRGADDTPTAGEGVTGAQHWGARESSMASPDVADALVDAAYVDWLFTKVTPDGDAALRLYYGFTDEPTEALRESHGYRLGELLNDDQVGHVLSRGRSTAQRLRASSLAAMRDAATLALADEL